ncbi:hypothetical protein A6A06_15570 [Streptomyces sp. CB02923]|nr:hypothetical protein A6A06_15570 [Streptomyces sp. CB02923]
MAELAAAVDETLLGLGQDITTTENRLYRTYRRLRNFACVCPPQKSKLLVYLKADPKEAGLVSGFSRDGTGPDHHGTGDLEVRLRPERDLERAQDQGLFRLGYAAA